MRFLNKVVVGSLVNLVTSASGSLVRICDSEKMIAEGNRAYLKYFITPADIDTLIRQTYENDYDRMLLCELILTHKNIPMCHPTSGE
jgi:hypothetical protein